MTVPENLEPHSTLETVRLWFWNRLETLAAVECPVCRQNAKIYAHRQVTAKMTKDLITAYRNVGVGQWFRWNDSTREDSIWDTSKEAAKLAHWGLIEERPGNREDGARHTGDWRITLLGEDFLMNRTTIPRYAVIYNKELQRLDGSRLVSVLDTLGQGFNYSELMGA